ncbi:hypothetical protein AADW59_00475 [Candidatus Hodgkinia cicadicola]
MFIASGAPNDTPINHLLLLLTCLSINQFNISCKFSSCSFVGVVAVWKVFGFIQSTIVMNPRVLNHVNSALLSFLDSALLNFAIRHNAIGAVLLAQCW